MPYQPDNGQGNFGAFPGYSGGQAHPSQLPQLNNDPRYLQQYGQPAQRIDSSNLYQQQSNAFAHQPQFSPQQQQQAYYQQYPAQYHSMPQASYLPPQQPQQQQHAYGQGVQQPVYQNQYQALQQSPQQYQQPQPQIRTPVHPQVQIPSQVQQVRRQSHSQPHPQTSHHSQPQGYISSPQQPNQHLQGNLQSAQQGQANFNIQRQQIQQQPQPQLQHQQPQYQQQYQQPTQSRPVPSQVSPRPTQQSAWPPQASPTASPNIATPQRVQQSPSQNQPHSQPRQLAHVAIPIQRSTPPQQSSQMPHVPKRRRSNDGTVIAVAAKPMPQKPSQPVLQNRIARVSIPSSPMPTSSQMPSTPTPSIDYKFVLLSLADEYVDAAYQISTAAASSDRNGDGSLTEEYQSLMATAMACLEAVLKSCRQSDSTLEARIRLRLASLMLEETENYQEIGEILSKGIALCDRNRLVDTKYAMYHLQAQTLFRSSPNAALKTIDNLVDEVGSLRLTHWSYTFRFLRVSLGLQINSQKNYAAALRHLASITQVAEEQRNASVQIIAAVYEAIIYLRSDSVDNLEAGQRALAAARTHQLGPEMQRLPHISALLDNLDVAFHCMHSNLEQLAPLVARMHQSMDRIAKGSSSWHKDEHFLIPLGRSNDTEIDLNTGGILSRMSTGETAMSFQWLTRGQLYIIGYLLNYFWKINTNSDNFLAENSVLEGLKMTARSPHNVLRSLASAQSNNEWYNQTYALLRLRLAFAYCGRAEWTEASKVIRAIRENLVTVSSEDHYIDLATLITYLEGLCKQGLGDLSSAYASFNSPSLAFDPTTKSSNALQDLCALATLNKISIVRAYPNSYNVDEEDLLSSVEPYCLAHHNKPLVAAYYIVKSRSASSLQGQIFRTKQFIQHAVNFAKSSSNGPLLCIVMNIMTHTYFNKIMTDQSEKSARVARGLAKKNRLWYPVATEMYAATLDLSGRSTEADELRAEGTDVFEGLPRSLKDSIRSLRESKA